MNGTSSMSKAMRPCPLIVIPNRKSDHEVIRDARSLASSVGNPRDYKTNMTRDGVLCSSYRYSPDQEHQNHRSSAEPRVPPLSCDDGTATSNTKYRQRRSKHDLHLKPPVHVTQNLNWAPYTGHRPQGRKRGSLRSYAGFLEGGFNLITAADKVKLSV